MLSVSQLNFKYRHSSRPALDGISFTVQPGEVVGIVGPNGAGKTTLCLTLNGLIPHAIRGRMTGTVKVDDIATATAQIHDLARKVGIVLQNPEAQLFGESVEEEIAFGPENLALPPAEIEIRIEHSLALVGMTRFRDRFPFHLSGGQKQRVAIAIALAMEPPILVMDEPTSELDPQGKSEVLRTIRRLNQEHRRTVVLASHETDELIQIADRIIVLSADGTMIADGKPAEVLGDDKALTLGVRQPQLFTLWNQLGPGFGAPPLDAAQAVQQLMGSIGARAVPKKENNAAKAPVQISCRNLVHEYTSGVKVLDGVNVDIRRGEFVAIMGQNGSGKTTLTKHFNCLLRPTSGSVTVEGKDTGGLSTAELARTVGYAFQNPDHQIFSQTVGEEFAFGLRNIGVPEQEIGLRTAEALGATRLDVGPQDYPHFLGKGERQKLALATILAMRPEILIVDEPTTGQDWQSAVDTMETLRALNIAGRTIIIVTHDTRVVAEYARRAIVMADGRIIADGSPSDIFYDREAMKRAALRPPPIVELAALMTPSGAPASGILTVDEFTDCLHLARRVAS